MGVIDDLRMVYHHIVALEAEIERLAAKAQGYDAAVADNAALLAAVNDVLNFVHLHSPDMGGNHRYNFMPKHGPAVARLQHLAAQPHSGAALLEEHREELAAAARRHETTRATMHVREHEHRKALVRARNEGLEKAAATKEYHAQQHDKRARRKSTKRPGEWAQLAKEARADAAVFRAMMEPEQ